LDEQRLGDEARLQGMRQENAMFQHESMIAKQP
jgi:hypothetical protein